MDVLFSYVSDILGIKAYTTRGNVPQPYVKDEADTIACYQTYEKISMGEGFIDDESHGSYVLVTSQDYYAKVSS